MLFGVPLEIIRVDRHFPILTAGSIEFSPAVANHFSTLIKGDIFSNPGVVWGGVHAGGGDPANSVVEFKAVHLGLEWLGVFGGGGDSGDGHQDDGQNGDEK